MFRLLCGPRASLAEEHSDGAKGVLAGALAAPAVERDEGDEAPSNPPAGGDGSSEDPPPYVRIKSYILAPCMLFKQKLIYFEKAYESSKRKIF